MSEGRSGSDGNSGGAAPARVGWKDLRVVLMLALTLLLSWLVPERHWWRVAGACARLREAIRKQRAERADLIAMLAGDHGISMPAAQCHDLYMTHTFVERFQLLRCYRPGGWRPEWRLEGREHIDRAFRNGNGVILWFAPSAYFMIVSKMAIFEAGFGVHYLSRYAHNLTDTLWGARRLNPVRTRIENRYLAERMVIWPGTERERFEALTARLSEGRIVGITVYHIARRIQDVPFLDGRLRLATAPAVLSRRLEAPLIPVFTVRDEDGGYTVTVNAPLRAAVTDDQDRAIERVLLQYRDLLVPYALRYPDQFRWQDVIADE